MKRAVCILLFATAACSSGRGDFVPPPPADDAGTSSTDPCAAGYPQGPYGTGEGKIVNPGLSWQGYLPNQTSASSVTPNDLFDCDGSKGINAIVFDVAAEWCAACQSQASNQPQLFSKYDALGIRVVTLVVQDASSAPATLATAQSWKQQYGLSDVAVCADPSFSFAPIGQSSVDLPVTIVVDPRTMKILKVSQGYVAAYPPQPDAEAVAIAQKNGG